MLVPDFHLHRLITEGHVDVEPYDVLMLQPASLDLRLHHLYRRPSPSVRYIDVADVPDGHTTQIDSRSHAMTLAPGQFILGCTAERIRLPAAYAGRVEGKSSLARLGIAVHVTGGFIDPGFDGQVTLEIANLSPWTIMLRAGMPIAQIALQELQADPHKLYASKGHYQGQSGPTESRYRLS